MMRIALVLAFSASVAYGQTQRTFVSAQSGNDGNPCSVTSPCRSFGTAMASTLSGGEIIVLDSGGYGVVTIDKSVSIISPAGVYAGVSAFSGNAVTMNAAGLRVVLEGLTLNGLGAAVGIGSAVQGTLYVRRCVITGFSNAGIAFYPGAMDLFAADNTIRNNGNYGMFAAVNNLSNRHHLVLDHNHFENNGTGIYFETNVQVNAFECAVVANGVAVDANDGEGTFARCLISANSTGVRVTYAGVRISDCAISGNTTKGISVLNPAGHVYSRANNTIEGNFADDAVTAYSAK